MLSKKDKQQPKHKTSIDIIREEINLEEVQETHKVQNTEIEEECNGFTNLSLQNFNKPVRKSSIQMIRESIKEDLKEEINGETNQKQQQNNNQDYNKEEFSLFKGINFNEKILLPQPDLQKVSSLNSQKISPPPGFPSPQKPNNTNNQFDEQFQINDFNYLNSNEMYYQYQQPRGAEIIRSNSEQVSQFYMMQNKQFKNAQQQQNEIKNNTPQSLQKKKLRLESDQFSNFHQTPQNFSQQQQQQQQQFQYSNNINSPLTSQQQQQQQFNILSPFSPAQQQQQQSQYQLQTQKSEKRKPLILSETNNRYLGTVKFFDEVKGYGFIILDQDNSEIFFHMDDIQQPFVPKEYIMTYQKGNIVRFSFTVMHYIGKYKQSAKATEIQLISL